MFSNLVYPLPRIDDTLDCLSKAEYFSSMDLYTGYWQIEVDEADREKTSFVTSEGLYEFKVMPFGLCNAPATFERAMDNLLRQLKWQMCLCYLDDIVVFSQTFPKHLERLCCIKMHSRSWTDSESQTVSVWSKGNQDSRSFSIGRRHKTRSG
ncbi:Retrovirus-related Pol polyprotein from transposon 297 [Araneus ventricosus]|uniref:Retrovirus-related Pol polyprotein from transposon 297 n=1 Tax=Araneus ventricosus TaxID=182803 RepID=A0A4Y2PUJ7_ARAVE|nr:Retrovirus-related Pol polyprotein from transposon 297 [Araneus ventricosus]